MDIYDKVISRNMLNGLKSQTLVAPIKEGARIRMKIEPFFSWRYPALTTWAHGTLEYRNWLDRDPNDDLPYLFCGIRYGAEEHEWQPILDHNVVELDS